jgi:wobble nucleotide-excising tRNase
MTKRDNEDAELALVSGGIGALFGYGAAKPKIEKLEAEKRQLQEETIILRDKIAQKDTLISQLQVEIKRLRDGSSIKNMAKSLFDRV